LQLLQLLLLKLLLLRDLKIFREKEINAGSFFVLRQKKMQLLTKTEALLSHLLRRA
jgi:hypothetical protein